MSNKEYFWKSFESRYGIIAALLLSLTLIVPGCASSRHAGSIRDGNLRDVVRLGAILPLASPIGDVSRIIVAGDAGTAYIYRDQDWKSTNTVQLLRVREQSGGADSIALNIPQDSALDRRGSLADIAVDGNHIALLFWKALLIYKRGDGQLTSGNPVVVSLVYPYKQVRFVGGRCFVGMCSLGAREYGDHFTYAAEIDPDAGRLIWEIPLPDPDGFQFTSFLPRRIMEFTNNGILVADLTRYHIVFYDSLGRASGTLTRHIADWESRYDSSFRRYRPLIGKVPYSMKSLLDTVRPYISKMYMIRLVDAIDDSTILVAWQTPYKHESGELKGLEKVYYDTWRRRGGNWELFTADLPDFNPQWTDSFAVERMFPLFWSYWSIGNSRIVLLDPLPPMNLETKTYGEIRKAVDSAFIEGEPPSSLIYLGVAR